MSKRKQLPAKPWEARIPGTPAPKRIAFPKHRPSPTAGTITGRFSNGSGPTIQSWASGLARYSAALTSEPTLAAQGVHTLWDRRMNEIHGEYNARMDMIRNSAPALPTPKFPTNQGGNMPHDAPHRTLEQAHKQERAAAGFVHPHQRTLRTWANPSNHLPLPTIEIPLQGVAWHSPKTQQPGGSHSTPGLTLRSTRVRDDLFFAIADGVDSPVQVQFRIPMAALVTMLARYQSLVEKPAGYMMYLTEDGELRFPTSENPSPNEFTTSNDSQKG